METRVLIAVLLSIAVMFGFSYLFPQANNKPANYSTVQGAPSSARQLPVQKLTSETLQVATPVTGTTLQAMERELVVETDLYRAVFSTRGAALKKFALKAYRESAAQGSAEIALIDVNGPPTLTDAADGIVIDPQAIFASSAHSLILTGAEKKEIEFVWTSPQGLTLRKIYSFVGNGYAIELNRNLSNSGNAALSGTLRLNLVNKVVTGSKEGRYEVYGPVTLSDNKVTTTPVADLSKGPKSYDKQVTWTGFADKYFLNSVLSKDGSLASVKVSQVNPTLIESVISSPRLTLNPGQSVSIPYRLYFGPKDLGILKSQGSRLEEVIDFGWFSVIAKPLLYTIKFFKTYTGNYGLAIIIITVILKIFFYPLTHKSYKSMKAMQKLQPKMAELKEKFKNDRDAMNRAVMELYKTHKVNPLGGCLPMLVQIPVFFALYKALMFSIELRHAPFYFWIQDLSSKDPYYVTPVIMGVSMFIQQKMTPTNMDPVQEKMMLMLPVVFTFMFLNFPSGLVLYWLVNNILTIAQQTYINKTIK